MCTCIVAPIFMHLTEIYLEQYVLGYVYMGADIVADIVANIFIEPVCHNRP